MLRFSSRQFGTFGTDPLSMYNVKGLLTSLLGSGRADLILPLTAAAWLVGIGLTLWLWRRPGAADLDGRLALTFLLATVVNPHVNPADVLVVVLPAVLFVGHLRQREQWGQAAGFAAVAAACPLLFLIDCYLLDPARLGFRPFFVVMVAVTGWMLASLVRGEQHALPAAEAA
jgi:hypothetical protein